MKYQIYKDLSGFWRWRFVAANGRIVADSAEGYWNKSDCLAGIQMVKTSALVPVYDA